MARDLRLNIQGDSSSADKAFASATAALEKASKELRTAEARTDALAVKARKLAEAEERAGDKARDLAAQAAALRKQIEETGDETGALGRKLDRLTRDTKFAALATDDYRRAADRAAADAREQARAYDKVADNARQAARAVAFLGAASALTPDGKGGKKGFFSGISDAFREAFGLAKGGAGAAGGVATSAAQGGLSTPGVGPLLILGGASAAGLAAFPVGGAIGGATLAGLGGGVAGAGLAGAWMANPEKFQAKWDSLVDHVTKRWIDSSKAYGDELDDVLKIAAQTADRLPLEKILAVSQSFVRPLAAGAGAGIGNFGAGLADALNKAQPVVDTLGPKLGELGHAAGDALRAISMGSEGGAQALGDLVDGVNHGVRAFGVLILGLEDGYEQMRKFAKGTYDVATSIPIVGRKVESFAGSIWHIVPSTVAVGRSLDSSSLSSHKFGAALVGAAKDAAGAAIETLGLNDAITKTRDNMMAGVDANIAWAQGWLDLNKELKEGTKTLNLNTQEGINNQKAIRDQIALAERQREETIKNSDHTQAAIDAANKKYYDQVEAIKQAAYAAHFNKDQVDALITSLGAVPPDTKADVEVSGLEKSLGQGISLGNALNNIDGRTYHASLSFSLINSWVLDAARSVGAHARGGTFPTSGPKTVGEHGMEMIWGNRGEYVSTAEQTRQLVSMMGSVQSGGGSAAGAVSVVAAPTAAADPLSQLVLLAIDSGRVQLWAGSQRVTTRRG